MSADLVMAMNYRRHCHCYRCYWCWQWRLPARAAATQSLLDWPYSPSAAPTVAYHLLDVLDVLDVLDGLDGPNAERLRCWPTATETMRSASRVHLHRRVALAEAVLCLWLKRRNRMWLLAMVLFMMSVMAWHVFNIRWQFDGFYCSSSAIDRQLKYAWRYLDNIDSFTAIRAIEKSKLSVQNGRQNMLIKSRFNRFYLWNWCK